MHSAHVKMPSIKNSTDGAFENFDCGAGHSSHDQWQKKVTADKARSDPMGTFWGCTFYGQLPTIIPETVFASPSALVNLKTMKAQSLKEKRQTSRALKTGYSVLHNQALWFHIHSYPVRRYTHQRHLSPLAHISRHSTTKHAAQKSSDQLI